jgi:hypothetical protein
MKGKTVVITGGTSGIGEVAAEKLAELGARIVLVARDKSRANATLRRLRERGPRLAHSVHYADLTRLTEMKRVAAEIAVQEPTIDVLINNGGALFATRQITEDGLEYTFALNHMAYFVLTAGLRARLVASAPSRIVNTASDAHHGAIPDHIPTLPFGADGLVLFNRFYQPDIDLATLRLKLDLELSTPAEIRLSLLWIAILHGRVSASLAASTGVESADEVYKYLLAGADTVMTTSSLLRHGINHMGGLLDGLVGLLAAREFASVAEVRGRMSQKNLADPTAFERANYMQILQRYRFAQSA